MEVTTVGLDLGKDVFQVHGIASDGTVVFNRSIRRRQLLKFFAALPSCLIGIEACGSAHHWARELIAIGHDVRLMPAVYVKPYVKRGKTDAVDAEAICEAVTRPTMRFVAVKSKEQQALLTMHRVRQLIVRQKTQMLNVIRGLLREFGHVIGNGPWRRCASSKLSRLTIAQTYRMWRRACSRRFATRLLLSMTG
ncbi:IS110 family transposase [Leisingera sp. M527]|uniref:IS110 family transposase n=1 Tax=Leisingera sp. M527 TaxID=2867014 RepID=UPI0038FBF76D